MRRSPQAFTALTFSSLSAHALYNASSYMVYKTKEKKHTHTQTRAHSHQSCIRRQINTSHSHISENVQANLFCTHTNRKEHEHPREDKSKGTGTGTATVFGACTGHTDTNKTVTHTTYSRSVGLACCSRSMKTSGAIPPARFKAWSCIL